MGDLALGIDSSRIPALQTAVCEVGQEPLWPSRIRIPLGSKAKGGDETFGRSTC